MLFAVLDRIGLLFMLVFRFADKTTWTILEVWEGFGSKTSEYAGEGGGCALLATAACSAAGQEHLIVQLVPGMLVLKSIFSKEPNLHPRSLTCLDLCDQAGTWALKESSPLLPGPEADRQGEERHEEENLGC